MKKILLTVITIINILITLYFCYLSILNLIYFNSKTVGISVFNYGITANGICFPLHLITILLIISAVFLINKTVENYKR